MAVDPVVELRLASGLGLRVPLVVDVAVDPLRAGGAAAGLSQSAVDSIKSFAEAEVELDVAARGAFMNEFAGAAAAAAVLAEEGEGDGVEEGRLAAAVGAS